MRNAIRVLIVEGSADDALLLARELARGPWPVTHERVESAAALSEALARGEWDLVVSDCALPDLDGLTALAMVRSVAADTPVILVSGVVGEAAAADAMRAGAGDFLVKGHLQRLVPAACRELARADDRRAVRDTAARLATAEARGRDLFASSNDGILLLDAHVGRVADVNPALLALLGRPGRPLPGQGAVGGRPLRRQAGRRRRPDGRPPDRPDPPGTPVGPGPPTAGPSPSSSPASGTTTASGT